MPMNAEQVKQATDTLVTERAQLNTEAQNANQADPPAAQPGVTGSVPGAKKKKKPVPAHAARTDPTQTAGADSKP